MTEKHYVGRRDRWGCEVYVHHGPEADAPFHALPLRLDIANKSPTGFEWGYVGSGPAQLAIALLADVLGDDDLAFARHNQFMRLLICALPHQSWVIHEWAIRWLSDFDERPRWAPPPATFTREDEDPEAGG
jgi:hypothetical protein